MGNFICFCLIKVVSSLFILVINVGLLFNINWLCCLMVCKFLFLILLVIIFENVWCKLVVSCWVGWFKCKFKFVILVWVGVNGCWKLLLIFSV